MRLLSASLMFMSIYLMWPLGDFRSTHWKRLFRARPILMTKSVKRRDFDFKQSIQTFVLLCTAHLQTGVHFNQAVDLALKNLPPNFLPQTRISIRHQVSISEALARDASRSKHESLRLLSVGAQISERTGMSLLPMMREIQRNIERQTSLTQTLKQEISSTRATVFLLALLPIIGIALSMMLGSNALNWLTTTIPGRVCGAIGITLEGLGLLWIRRMLEKAIPR